MGKVNRFGQDVGMPLLGSWGVCEGQQSKFNFKEKTKTKKKKKKPQKRPASNIRGSRTEEKSSHQ